MVLHYNLLDILKLVLGGVCRVYYKAPSRLIEVGGSPNFAFGPEHADVKSCTSKHFWGFSHNVLYTKCSDKKKIAI